MQGTPLQNVPQPQNGPETIAACPVNPSQPISYLGGRIAASSSAAARKSARYLSTLSRCLVRDTNVAAWWPLHPWDVPSIRVFHFIRNFVNVKIIAGESNDGSVWLPNQPEARNLRYPFTQLQERFVYVFGAVAVLSGTVVNQ